MHGSSSSSIEACLIGWSVGVASTLLLPELPSPWLPGAAGILLACVAYRPWLRYRYVHGRSDGKSVDIRVAAGLAVFLFGLSYGVLAGRDGLEHRLPDCGSGVDYRLSGRIESLSGKAPWRRLELAVQDQVARTPGAGACHVTPRRVRLSWRSAPDVAVGELWTLVARLRAPRGTQNRFGFDYEGWLFARHIDATGYVRGGARRLAPASGLLNRWRSTIRSSVADLGLASEDVLIALILGDSGLLSDARWNVLRRTGTIHLLIVSGLHIGIVAGAVFLAAGWLCRAPFVLRRCSSRSIGSLLGAMAATGYAALAGWSLPVQRAWLMALLMFIWLQSGRRVSVARWYLACLALILALQPLAPLLSGFWLSFGAVALLLGYYVPRPPRGRIRQLVGVQVLLLVGLAPLLMRVNDQLAALAPIANFVAVPLMTLLVVPMALLAALLLPVESILSPILLGAADQLIGSLFDVLQVIAGLAEPMAPGLGTSLEGRLSRVAVVMLTLCAIALATIPLGVRLIGIAGAVFLLVLSDTSPAPSIGAARVEVLDVGQGLSVIVSTAHHRLVYDTGPSYPSGFDLGAAVVLPNLQGADRAPLDQLIISHPDNDHRGGAAAVVAEAAPRWIIAGQDADQVCLSGQRWQWDGVRFTVLHPGTPADPAPRNDHSCVLLVEASGASALLPGDIERLGERALLRNLTTRIQLLVAPHHGSRTSSSSALLARAAPGLVFISNGYGNRFGHPHAQVLERYRQAGAQWYQTARSGGLSWSSDEPGSVRELRYVSAPYWRVRSAMPN